jgi:hypothetical protein
MPVVALVGSVSGISMRCSLAIHCCKGSQKERCCCTTGGLRQDLMAIGVVLPLLVLPLLVLPLLVLPLLVLPLLVLPLLVLCAGAVQNAGDGALKWCALD